MEVQLTVLRAGESAPKEPGWALGPNQIQVHAPVERVIMLEDGMVSGQPSLMLFGRSADGPGNVAAMEMSWQLWHTITGAGLSAFGEPTGETRIPLDPETLYKLRESVQMAIDVVEAAE